jgi:hypothetical protein
MFYITKHLRGKPRRYLYEAYRDNKTGKAKRRLVAYLGDFKTVRERLAYISTELVRAKRKESELQRILEPGLCELRRRGSCPSWETIKSMEAGNRRITFFPPGTFDASKQNGPLQMRIAKMEADATHRPIIEDGALDAGSGLLGRQPLPTA